MFVEFAEVCYRGLFHLGYIEYFSMWLRYEGCFVSRRGRVDIIADILVAAGDGDTKTGIMYRSNLNFARFERYFGELVDVGLIEVVDGIIGKRRAVYKASKKAVRLLSDLKRVDDSIKKQVNKG